MTEENKNNEEPGEGEPAPEVEPVAEEPGEDEDLPGEDELPPYAREEEPTGLANRAKYWLLKGLTKEEVAEQHGISFGTVRVCESELVSEGYLKKKPRGAPTGAKKTTKVTTVPQGGKTTQIFAKGSPPEALIQAIELAGVDGELVDFEHGMKFGMSILVTAVRVMNELSIIGSQQVRPLLDMTKSMREGEAQSYKAGADEAAFKAASAIGATIAPEVDAIKQAVMNIEKGASGDPVKAMMVRTMEPLIQGLMGRMIPGGGGGPASPQGWKKRTETTEEAEKVE